jgi:DNA processing protein
MNSTFDVLKLYRSKNIGPISFFYLINRFKNAKNAVENIKFLEDKWQKKIELAKNEEIEQEILLTEKFGAKFLIYSDENFPQAFQNLNELTPILITLGNQNLLSKNLISIVGTRIPSINGLKFAANISKEFSEMDFVTVSGFAKGIDTEVHKNSKKAGTIAVFAGGIDIIYPKENEKIFHEIKDFCLFVSDQAIGTNPSSKFFPKRNTIIAALGQATIVIESTLDSGALITAKNAKKYGRKIFSVPGHPFDNKYSGNNFLLKNGAFLLTEIKDVLENLNDISDQEKKIYFFEDFSSEEQKIIFNLLSFSPSKISDLENISQISINKILSILIEMEIIGLVKINPDNSVYKIENTH